MNDKVFSQEPYTESHHRRTTNEDDGVFRRGAGRGGYDAFADMEYVDGDDMGKGLIGYISKSGKGRSRSDRDRVPADLVRRSVISYWSRHGGGADDS